MQIQGVVTDPVNNTVIAFATIEGYLDGLLLGSAVANSSGAFVLNVPSTPDTIIISSASYTPGTFRYPGATNGGEYQLFPNIVEGENVVIVSPKPKEKKSTGLFGRLIGGFAVYYLLKKK